MDLKELRNKILNEVSQEPFCNLSAEVPERIRKELKLVAIRKSIPIKVLIANILEDYLKGFED